MEKIPRGNRRLFQVISIFALAIAVASVFYVVGYKLNPVWSQAKYEKNIASSLSGVVVSFNNHLPTPKEVRGVYMTACIAATPPLREKMLKELEGTGINTIVIDVKDYSGNISIPMSDSTLNTDPKKGCHYNDAKDFISKLHEKGYYVIARLTVFQDPLYTKLHPELAVKKASDGSVWRDRKGLAFIDVSARPYWEHIVKIAKESYATGFDELNFDYIRFPSDGDMKDIAFPWTGDMEKKEALRHFFGYLKKEFRGTGAILSADLFGMTTENTDDLNIGQYLEFALPYFDYIAPMVYPSHYPPNWRGYPNPAEKPYEVIKYSMGKAYERASTTPEKLRPWLQDFNLGAIYTVDMVKAQMKGVYDSGLTSWMLWSPSNRYTAGALNFLKE